MLRLFTTLLLCFLALLAGCGPSPAEKEEILRPVRTRAEALNARNLPQYLSVISPAYNDKGKDIVKLRKNLEVGFKMYDSVSYQADEQHVKLKGQQAEVKGKYRLRVVIRGKELVLDGNEHLMLAKEPDGWKIISGL